MVQAILTIKKRNRYRMANNEKFIWKADHFTFGHKIDHLNTRLFRYSDSHCIQRTFKNRKKLNLVEWPKKSGSKPHLHRSKIGHPNTGHPNTGTIWKPDIFVSSFGMVFYYPISGPVFKWSAKLDQCKYKRMLFFMYKMV